VCVCVRVCVYVFVHGDWQREKCNRWDILKNPLDEKGIQYHGLDQYHGSKETF